MQFKTIYLLTCLMVAAPLIEAGQNNTTVVTQQKPPSNNGVDIDDLENQMIQANAVGTFVAKPPHPIMVYLRRIGIPLLHAFIKVRAALRSSWRWLMQSFLFRWYTRGKQAAS
jgi:hypothetical protein